MGDEPHVHDLGVSAALALLGQGRARLIDVREPDEWNSGHAPRAEHIPLANIDAGAFSGDLLVVTCRSGKRSRKAVSKLRWAGVEAYSLEGGMQAWARAGEPIVGADGSVGTIA